ncbi:hypothetical protein CYMTET_51189 [Cymbomonas tetramitiformis]|uniref:Uncharacterized protein n=1 Tax=Cymbomonas tetramitiformis TaxID=36881 RepID=A0AAE0BMU0_9CHLO|nr:hypothetical protein CYMTET_51189 [Cymbomonas tetramitiformis]
MLLVCSYIVPVKVILGDAQQATRVTLSSPTLIGGVRSLMGGQMLSLVDAQHDMDDHDNVSKNRAESDGGTQRGKRSGRREGSEGSDGEADRVAAVRPLQFWMPKPHWQPARRRGCPDGLRQSWWTASMGKAATARRTSPPQRVLGRDPSRWVERTRRATTTRMCVAPPLKPLKPPRE